MIRMILLGGFLGAGKTTTLIETATRLERAGHRVAVITNDQGENLVDTAVSRDTGLVVGEVTGGCFCCRFEDLVRTTIKAVEERGADTVLAEAVGSCTDLAATVIRPLREFYGDRFRVSPLTVLVDPVRYGDLSTAAAASADAASKPSPKQSVAYLFRKQLEDADIIALNKLDLLSSDELAAIERELADRYPFAQVVSFSAKTGRKLDGLVDMWTRWSEGHTGHALEINYDTYADAEAQLAWLNATLDLQGQDASGFSPAEWVDTFLVGLSHAFEETDAFVGHVKVQLTTPSGVTSASLIRTGARPSFRLQQWSAVGHGELVLNARVATDPRTLESSVLDTLSATDEATSTRSRLTQWSAFQPARPQPVHRMAAA